MCFNLVMASFWFWNSEDRCRYWVTVDKLSVQFRLQSQVSTFYTDSGTLHPHISQLFWFWSLSASPMHQTRLSCYLCSTTRILHLYSVNLRVMRLPSRFNWSRRQNWVWDYFLESADLTAKYCLIPSVVKQAVTKSEIWFHQWLIRTFPSSVH